MRARSYKARHVYLLPSAMAMSSQIYYTLQQLLSTGTHIQPSSLHKNIKQEYR